MALAEAKEAAAAAQAPGLFAIKEKEINELHPLM
jgi:hypothetical protein